MLDLTLKGILAQINSGKIVLPAMQRPFVWQEERITRLIDSLLRGFPLGSVMMWRTDQIQRYRLFKNNVLSDGAITTDFMTNKSNELYTVLDGQQRLTSLYVAIYGTYDSKKLFINIFSGEKGEKDPGSTYWDCQFLSQTEADVLNSELNTQKKSTLKKYFLPFSELANNSIKSAGKLAINLAQELELDENETEIVSNTFMSCASSLLSSSTILVHLLDADISNDATSIDEILEIFVRINSGGLVLQKSDLLMSLLDIEWNNIQPELFRYIDDINRARPFRITRDDLLKSLLLVNNSETRFDRLIQDRKKIKSLALELPKYLPDVVEAWKKLTAMLVDNCKITSERFFRGGHNSLLPFVVFLMSKKSIRAEEKQRIVVGLYITLMSGIFAGAEARMGTFSRKHCLNAGKFPLNELSKIVYWQYGIESLEDLLSRHLDLTLNIAHGGITIDNNPENLQRDHIFPRAKLISKGLSQERVNHYANFHFLRDKDNLNKSDTPPHKWFKKPGDQPSYTDLDLEERLLTWDLIQPNKFKEMIATRSKSIQNKALDLFNMKEEEFSKLFFVEESE